MGSDDGKNYRRRRRSRLRRLAALPGREAPLVERAHKNKEARACGRSQFHSPVAGRSRGADSTGGSVRTGRQQKLAARHSFEATVERGVGGKEDDDEEAAAAGALTTTLGYMRTVDASACASRAPLRSSSKHGSRAPPSPLLPMRPSIWRRTIFLRPPPGPSPPSAELGPSAGAPAEDVCSFGTGRRVAGRGRFLRSSALGSSVRVSRQPYRTA